MSLPMMGLIGLACLLLLIFLNLPIGFAMCVVGFVGIGLVRGMDAGLTFVRVDYFSTMSKYAFAVIPLFIAMGFLATEARLSEGGFNAINKWIGQLRGGLAMAAAGACGVFAAICGDPIATATTVASVSLPEMRKRKYDDKLSLGCLAAGGNLGFLIPPSQGFIIYGLFTEQSIGTLFIAGLVPGILLTLMFMFTIWIWCHINPSLGPPSPRASWRERFVSLRGVIPAIILIILVLGGLYSGIFTASEAGAVGCFGVIVVGLIQRKLNGRGMSTALLETARLTGKVFILVTGAIIFSRFLTVTEAALSLANSIHGMHLPPYAILAIILIFYVLIGFIMDIMSVVVIMAPILHPVIVGMGFDGIWFGVLTMITILIGQITPPVGIVVFGLAGYVTDVPTWKIFKGVFPFVWVMIICLVILIIFPQITLWLPYLSRVPFKG